MEIEAGLKTLEDACAERGVDWEENMEQIAREKERMRELGDIGNVISGAAVANKSSVEGDEKGT
uniref:Uncharacterized protein n=1 Tax=Candidatus Kentrum sp. LPFa TaxID=2126335 RepID=A0A450WAJ3_9GAMM|nr:MAG: hypothetical protein BECKLPF1236A_GA0070988_100997 [Candidatus Kentron sp. LPFa]VFK30325.1 MAG: hypothetical protein BECKLPF1236C_GA0070990_101087 [Candidatus Kentron sp. LPFa]